MLLLSLSSNIPDEERLASKRSTRDTLHCFLGGKEAHVHTSLCLPVSANLRRKLNSTDTAPWNRLRVLAPTSSSPMRPQARVLDPCG